jgi:hypothetical protein
MPGQASRFPFITFKYPEHHGDEFMSTIPAERSSAARTKRHRERRRRGKRCITVELSEDELTGLVAGGYLPTEARADAMAIKRAIETVISDIAFDLEYGLAASSRPR